MSKIVNERHRIAKIILGLLVEKPRRWSELEKLTTRISPTYTKFQSTLNWLRLRGYTTKRDSGKKRSPYVVTEKGKFFYKAIS